MKKILMAAAAGIAVAVFQSAAWAVDAKLAQDEMKEHGCLKCHEMDKKKVGPGFNEVSAKYKGKKWEEAMAGMKAKPVHKATLQKATDSSLKAILEWVVEQK
jgi:cytochrome c551/c552